MKKLFAVVFVCVLVVIGLGFYRGWFALTSPGADNESNKVNVNLSVDGDKMKADAESVKKKTTEMTGNITGGEKNADDYTKE